MLKFKKFFTLALLTAVVGMFNLACVEPPVTEETDYKANIVGGTMTFEGKNAPSGSIFYKGDVITVTAAPPAGKVFEKWTATGGTFANANNPTTTFTMPGANVTITANFVDEEEEDIYSAKVIEASVGAGGGVALAGEDGDEKYITETFAMAGDLVYAYHGIVPVGKVFDKWTSMPTVTFTPVTGFPGVYSFKMPNDDIVITAVFVDEEEDIYSAKVIEASVGAGGGVALEGEDTKYITETFAMAGDLVYAYHGTVPAGKVFDKWTSTPTVTFTPVTGKPGVFSFRMPDEDIVITAVFENETFEVKVVGGTAPGGKWYEKGEDVVIEAGKPLIGMLFDKWTTADDGVTFEDHTLQRTSFPMIDKDVAVKANYTSDGDAYIRFSWQASDADDINYIYANEAQVGKWLTDIWQDDVTWHYNEGDDNNDFSHEPYWTGSPELPNDIFPTYKSEYLVIDDSVSHNTTPADAGWYTAVASVKDEFLGNKEAFIVVNYRVIIEDEANRYDLDAKRWFEVAFDVASFLAHDGYGDPWYFEVHDNANTDPRLEKRKGGRIGKKVRSTKISNKFGTFEANYYVIRTLK